MRVLSWLCGLRRSTFFAVCTLVLAVEALAGLLLSAEGRHHVLGSADGVGYEQYARNLAEHQVFSSAASPPFSPSVFRTPGYPAFLAVLHLAAGNSLALVRAAQFCLVGVTALLIYLIAAQLAGLFVARFAALLCITYLPFLWLARDHLSDVLATALAAAIVLLVIWAMRVDGRRSLLRFALVGILVGIAGLVRPEMTSVIVVIVAGAIAWPGQLTRLAAAKGAAVMVLMCLITLVPWTLRNYHLTHRVIPLGTASGASLYASALQWDGSISMQFTVADWRRDIAWTNAILTPVIQKDVARHAPAALLEIDDNNALQAAARREAGKVGVTDVISRLPKRLAYLWAVGDEPPVGAYNFWHDVDRVQYVVILVLVLIGLVLSLRDADRRRSSWVLLAFAVLATAVHLVFHVQARYTMPARPMLLVFAAAGLVWLMDRGGTRRADGRSRA